MYIVCRGSRLSPLPLVTSRPKAVDAIFKEQVLIGPVCEAHDAPSIIVVRLQLLDGCVDVCEMVCILQNG